jgi:predicted ATPase/DNA-binding winged helix-turn-helix (wHTH) protein
MPTLVTYGSPLLQLSDSASSGSHRFGPFGYDPAKRLLRDGTRTVQLGSRATAILEVFLERPGELIDKETIVSRVWPETFVEEVSLRVHISSLRRALGDGTGSRRFLVTVPGRGYQFVAPVTREDGSTPELATASAAAAARSQVPLTRIIDRAGVVNAIAEQLSQQRLVTITGPGGIGKTTVANAVLKQQTPHFPDGVQFVDLSPLRPGDDLATAVATTLGLAFHGAGAAPALHAALERQRALLVLDSCERVVQATAFLVEHLLRNAPHLHVLATSRERLRAEGERLLHLPTLATPPVSGGLSAVQAMAYAAVQLFVERAADANDQFVLHDAIADDVAFICSRLDGIPLAIELAAGHMNVMDVPNLAHLLRDRLGLLARGKRTALARHQTLRAVHDWSFQTLLPLEKVVLCRLATVPGAISMAAACTALAAVGLPRDRVVPAVAALVDKSLLVADIAGSQATYRLLDTTREYAIERLDGGEPMPSAMPLATPLNSLSQR